MYVAAIIAAGGQGARLGADRPKQFIDLGDGTNMLQRSVEAVAGCAAVDEVVVALPPGAHESMLSGLRLGRARVLFVDGGPRRQDSVAHALARVSPRADLVLIHDAARPFVTSGLVERIIRAAHEHGAAIAALPVRDTVKRANMAAEGEARFVAATLPREEIFLAQTPQAFRRHVLARAMEVGRDAPAATDEAMLVEIAGFPVRIVEGDPENIKVTTAHDLEYARVRVKGAGVEQPPTAWRIGTGYDLHKVVERRPLVLAGVRIPFDRGLDGHSDADIVCHAVTDAVLGASGEGDIGRLFPDSDLRWKGADSLVLLGVAMERVRAAGFRMGNLDVTVIAEQPKLVPHLLAMRANLAAALGCDVSAVSIKGKTNEGVDSLGRGESMACHAVALLFAVRDSLFAFREP